ELNRNKGGKESKPRDRVSLMETIFTPYIRDIYGISTGYPPKTSPPMTTFLRHLLMPPHPENGHGKVWRGVVVILFSVLRKPFGTCRVDHEHNFQRGTLGLRENFEF